MKTSAHRGRIAPGLLAIFVTITPLHAAPGAEGRGPSVRQALDPRAAAKEDRMNRWRSLRFGLFIHWGPYSVLGGEWQGKTYPRNTEWLMRSARISRADYREAARGFDPQGYDPEALVAFAKKCGFQYIVMTAKHYDGFALFDSAVSDFDAVDVLPSKRDLLKEFSEACKKGGMPLGFSYAVNRDWYHPGGDTLGDPWDPSQAGYKDEYLKKVALPQLRELLGGYGPALSLMADPGDGLSSGLIPEFQAVLGKDVVMATDFSGATDFRYTDGLSFRRTVTPVDWEKCTNLGNSWGYRKGSMNYQSPETILKELIATNSSGGNYLLNVGLDSDGRIPAEASRRLEAVGDWLSKYGESIEGTARSPFVKHSWDGGATVRDEGEKGATLYLHLFGKEKRDKITLDSLLTGPERAEVMGSGETLPVTGSPGAWEIDLSGWEPREEFSVLKLKLPSMPKLGEGPISARADGGFDLILTRAEWADRRTMVRRTPASSAPLLTGFGDEKESGTWELRSAAAVTVGLGMRTSGELPAAGKELVITVNGERVADAKVLPPAGPGKAARVECPAFRLPAGTSRVGIAGKEGAASSGQISVSKIELVANP